MMKKDPVANSTKISVTFEMPAEIQAERLAVVGDFNGWDGSVTPMKRRKDGTWARTIRLAPGRYLYRIVADDSHWLNDGAADGYELSEFGEDNCVLILA
jgi:1,4-alpha-glucan branching enzyme